MAAALRAVLRHAFAALIAVSAQAALDPLLPAASPWTIRTRQRWTRRPVTRCLVFDEVGGACWFDDDQNEEGTWKVHGDAVSFTTKDAQNVTCHYHCMLSRNHGLSGTSGRPQLVRGVYAGERRLFRPVLGSFSAASTESEDDDDRRGEAVPVWP